MFYFSTDDSSNSYELSEEMDSISSDKRQLTPQKKSVKTYFDEKIRIPREESVNEVDVSFNICWLSFYGSFHY